MKVKYSESTIEYTDTIATVATVFGLDKETAEIGQTRSAVFVFHV